jgi:hypothetical protein
LLESVRPTVEAAFRFCAENADLMRLFDAEMALDSEGSQALKQVPARVQFVAWLQEVIRRHAAREGLPVDPEMAARIIQWTMREACYECFVLGGGDPERYIQAVSEFLTAAFLGLQRLSEAPSEGREEKR